MLTQEMLYQLVMANALTGKPFYLALAARDFQMFACALHAVALGYTPDEPVVEWARNMLVQAAETNGAATE